MMFAKLLLIFTTILTFSSIAVAQAPAAQPAPAKVGLVNTAKFIAARGGVTRLVNAFRSLETEFKPKRDEITALVSRFNTLQADAAKTPTQAKREQLESLQVEITRKQEDARVAYVKRSSTLTDPIKLSIYNALEAFAKTRAVDVLIDVSKFPEGVLLVNPNADLTDAFIRDFNSKNP